MLDLTARQRREVHRIARQYDLKVIVAFGSMVTGRSHAESDLDVAVLPQARDLALNALMGLRAALSGLFDREVDVCFIHRADPLLLSQVFRRPQLLFGPRRKFQELQLYAFHRFQDYRPFFELEERCVRQQVEELVRAA